MKNENLISKRIQGLDFARAIAFIGMVIVNFKVALNAEKNGPSWLISLTNIFDGHAAATFVIISGIGISLFFQNNGSKKILLKRSLFLFVLGVLNCIVFDGDILHVYGVLIAISLLIIEFKNKILDILTILSIVLFLILFSTFNYEKNWNWETLLYSNFWTIKGFLQNLFYNGFNPVIPWIAFFLVGIRLGRVDFTNVKNNKKIFFISTATAIATELISRFLIYKTTGLNKELTFENTVVLFGTKPMPPFPIFMIASTATAISIVMGSIIIINKFYESLIFRPFILLGKQTLTLYLAHIYIGLGVLDVLGFMKNQRLSFAVIAALFFCLISLIYVHIWNIKFKHGPIEFIMRKISNDDK